jgi:uncharacterized protein YlxP (DUF503 family)
MFVAILQFELLIRGSESLKDKRRVVRSVKDRLHREHQVSVAEVGALDDMTLAMMALALVTNSPAHANEVLDGIVNKLRSIPDAQLGDTARDIISGRDLPESVEADGRPEAPIWTEYERRVLEEEQAGGGDRA